MKPAISAHRGGSEVYPAQTHAAFVAAASSGVEYVEFDVRCLADGTLVCFHDADIDGTPLSRLTYPDLRERAGYDVPLIEAVLDLLAGKAIAHIDLKEIGHESRVVTMALATLRDDFIVTSLEEVSLGAIRAQFPTVRTALSLGRGFENVPLHRVPAYIISELYPVRRIQACGAAWAAIDKNLAPWGVLGRCSRAGIGAMVWTVDGSNDIERFLTDPRVDVLVTNRPHYALQRRAALFAT